MYHVIGQHFLREIVFFAGAGRPVTPLIHPHNIAKRISTNVGGQSNLSSGNKRRRGDRLDRRWRGGGARSIIIFCFKQKIISAGYCLLSELRSLFFQDEFLLHPFSRVLHDPSRGVLTRRHR
jgi:hypothetical protein